MVCRNCGSVALKDLGPIGAVAPWVLKRIFNFEIGPAPAKHPLKRFLRKFTLMGETAMKIYGNSVLLDIQICTACSFIQTKVPLPEEGLAKHYADYRSDSYNQERIRLEPEFASIASRIGNDEQEINNRQDSLMAWLPSKINIDSDFSMLDYGGSDGRFLPDLPARKYVFDVSDIPPIAGIERVRDEASLGLYSYVQIAQVLEHVPFPLELTRKACSHLRPRGYLYVEVPQELSDEQIAQLSKGDINADQRIRVDIHEHINYYTVSSAAKLVESVGLTLIDARSEIVDLGWIKARIVRALGRKS